jgi:lysophospholipase L1-like esterase
VVLYFPTLDEFLTGDTTAVVDMEQIIAELQAPPDTTPIKTKVDSVKRLNKKIQYPNGDKTILYPVFAALEQAARGPGTSHVLHFGDSQIEGDRMTSLIRTRLQEKFGGSGPGLVAARPLVNSFSIGQEYSESMKRYALFAGRDTLIKHRRYGIMATISRFSLPVEDSLIKNTEIKTGWISLSKAGGAYAKSRQYSSMRMFYGYNRRSFEVKLFADDVPVRSDSFPVSDRLKVARWNFAQTPGKIMMIMNGADSPDIFGVSLESETGVQVDNISMRGSSGTVFGGISYGSFKPMLDSLNVKLILLQYGGNTVPYIKSKESAERYGKDFQNQINFLKKQVPGVGIILLGPSDMSEKVKGKMQTHAHLEDVRDALKKAAFESGAAYFDIYEVMGGRNSMVQWVEGEDRLAGSDYVHFTPGGAKLIAQKFINSFMEDYQAYIQSKTQ